MPIVLPKDLPAHGILREEGLEVTHPGRPGPGGGPVLRIALLNLMPEKAPTETQIARLLGDTAHRVELTLFVPDSYAPKTTPEDHMAAFYERWSKIRHRRFDGLIVTGAPVETLPFEAVTYWPELTEIFDWARQRVGQAYYICWAAQAALNHLHGVPKRALGGKMFGVFAHRVAEPDAPLLCELSNGFRVPVSRHTEVAAADLPSGRGLQVLADSADSGLCLVRDARNRAYFMFNHLEYDASTLAREYARDLRAGRPVPMPRNYFPGDDPARQPVQAWRGAARVLFRNWLDEVQRHAASKSDGTGAVDWLLDSGSKPVPVGARAAEFMIAVEQPLAAVPAVLRVLAGFGLSPSALRVKRAGEAEAAIRLRVEGIADGTLEAVARRILRRVAVARSVAFRGADGAGGLMVADRDAYSSQLHQSAA